MKFSEIVKQAVTLLQESQRVTYRALKREFNLDDEALEDLKSELIDGRRVAADEEGKVLVWRGEGINSNTAGEKKKGENDETEVVRSSLSGLSPQPAALSTQSSAAERRQLTVMFIDLVDSTLLSQQLDPEDYHARVRVYQAACGQVVARYEGHIAQYLGDGVLAYFGYPAAHEDDAARAVHSGLEIVAAMGELQLIPPLQVRVGLHTGPVVVAEIGTGARAEQLALGETPNIAARLQGVAALNTVVLSGVTQRLVAGLFDFQDLGVQPLKGVATSMRVYRVLGESTAHHRLDLLSPTGQTPLVGREEELALLQRRWEQVKDREGQAVLLSGEPGIGKSRLVRELRDRVELDGALRLEFRCSPYYQNSALYPLIKHVQRLLRWQKDDTVQTKLAKLQATLARYRFPQADTPGLFAMLLSLPQPADMPPLNLSPQRQKQKTEEALIAWLVEEAEQAPVYCAWEDLHWADPSTLELLGLLIEQIPTIRLFVLLTSRPEFTPSWGQHGHFSQLTLSRLGRRQVPQMIEHATKGKTLPTELVQQIVAKTDGVPLFIEELTKTVVESIESFGSLESIGSAIPATLQDSLMARLDRLGAVKEIAQVGATLGREFSYELLHAVAPMEEARLQQGLSQLVAVELLYQRGTPPQSSYLFKHALIQDTAYQSLLRSKRQQLHQQVAHILAAQFPDVNETQPELLAHHYTEAGLIAQAIPYWQQAGERATQRSAGVEAVAHLTRGLELLKTLPDTPERAQQELSLHLTLGPALMHVRGFAAPEAGALYTRARELCQPGGATAQLLPVLSGLWMFYSVRAELRAAQELGKQFLCLAQHAQDPALLLEAHWIMGNTLLWPGELSRARVHLEQSLTLYDPQRHHSLALSYGPDPGVGCLCFRARILWHLGYQDQALKSSDRALALATSLSHPYSLAVALSWAAALHHLRRETQAAQEGAEETLAFTREHEFPFFAAHGMILRGWALVEQGQGQQGIVQMRQGLAAYRATGAEIERPHWCALLAEAYGKLGQAAEGLTVLTEALAVVDENGDRYYEAELYRLKGELILQQGGIRGTESEGEKEAEARFQKAIAIARQQQAKSLELRAVLSLSRLRQQQGKKEEAHQLLAEVYGWFTEGFDTKDLQEAKALLDMLAEGQ
jgi:class 3 adenylate cyclase/predicted ATPase